MQKKNYTYLALGDSYTVGESLPLHYNFPNQLIRLLKEKDLLFEQPTIIAKTGWTTDELAVGIKNAVTQTAYDIVSLLIGVNNQYRGEKPGEYAWQFEELLQQAIRFAGWHPSHVFVLSIPDWGATPFAEGRDRAIIAREIDFFNRINREISEKHRVNYLDITEGTREVAKYPVLVASDGLHPSAKEYKRWAEKLAAVIQQELK
ncbi:MAG TPA: SGNH/GDSL hydrolase family protein [Flavitalea sp.]|nr:SGNH/GDSL hydrolase family protein [Flavitalea sp.]